jgi:hypothetical protein
LDALERIHRGIGFGGDRPDRAYQCDCQVGDHGQGRAVFDRAHSGLAACNLAVLLATQTDPRPRRRPATGTCRPPTPATPAHPDRPPNFDGARRWYQQAAEVGHAYAAYNLGALFARLGDVEASWAWRQVLDTAPGNDEFPAAAAAFALAALAAWAGDLKFAREYLAVAGEHGATTALVCASAVSPDTVERVEGMSRLRELVEDTDAMNFQSIAAYGAGDREEASMYWTRSSELGDAVAPLLVHLTTDPSKPPSD